MDVCWSFIGNIWAGKMVNFDLHRRTEEMVLLDWKSFQALSDHDHLGGQSTLFLYNSLARTVVTCRWDHPRGPFTNSSCSCSQSQSLWTRHASFEVFTSSESEHPLSGAIGVKSSSCFFLKSFLGSFVSPHLSFEWGCNRAWEHQQQRRQFLSCLNKENLSEK